ncbi:hypothetical protein F5B22DRAFT_395740 [Xylaria bambusicola]|uniref:uncharacterized protein n=1 Tax=Xylaria bambusicola TaxID=326684 RepID=UPI0020087B7E|nr:uncharacterized protein F5B22DRAFT_395740 [Xylaria bambusicola]KAI0508618.1 hypothetical protein F5B22DRAFT_395740 [Xylaria bambusicola]
MNPPTPQSTGDRSTVSSKPGRLRNACNACCAAKVKCSGERMGCARCRATGSSCQYVESKAGKVPGIRAKKRHTQSHDRGDFQSTKPGNTPPLEPHTSKAPDAAMSFAESNPNDIDWSNGWDIEGTDMNDDSYTHTASSITVSQTGHSSASAGPEMTPPSTAYEETYATSLADSSMENFELFLATSQPSLPEETADTLRVEILPICLGLRPRNETDSQCLLECCHMLSDLENVIVDEVKGSKIILGMVKQALDRMAHFIELQQDSRNLRCRMLFDTLMYQVVELLETCLSSATTDKERLGRGFSAMGSFSGLGYGDYTMDAEEQLAFRTQAILKEVRHATQILEGLKRLASPRPADGCNLSQTFSLHDCHRDLHLRFDDMTTRWSSKQ